MTPSERLLDRLRSMLGLALPPGARLVRTHAGRLQREQGVWSWYVVDADGDEVVPHVGSAETVTQLLDSERLVAWGMPAGYVEIGPGDALVQPDGDALHRWLAEHRG